MTGDHVKGRARTCGQSWPDPAPARAEATLSRQPPVRVCTPEGGDGIQLKV
ncbi:hypothetical protein SSAG_04565 [Streptomyces sp. Mg1]|nr:hypothetical protein SSAG_04565 [Streptomyces sp. Mg1]